MINTKVPIMILIFILLAGCAQQEDTITIGFIGSLTGGEAPVGQSVVKGIELAQEDFPDVQFVFEDDQGDTKEAVKAYHTLRDVHKVDAIIGMYSPQGNALSELVEEDQIIYCNAAASDHSISKGKQFTFLHWVTPEAEAKAYAARAKALGFEKVVSLESLVSGVTAVTDAVRVELEKEGIAFEQIKVSTEQQDFRTEVNKIAQEDFDAFLFLLFPSQSSPAFKQIKEQGIGQAITSVELFEFYSKEELALLEREEDWYVFASDPTEEFQQRFSGKYPGAATSLAPHGFDCATILVEALQQGSTEAAITHIHQLQDHKGAVGTLHYADGRIESPAVIKQVKDGHFFVT